MCDCHPLSLWYQVLQIDHCAPPYLGGFVGQFCGPFFALSWERQAHYTATLQP